MNNDYAQPQPSNMEEYFPETTFDHLVENVIQWGYDKGILGPDGTGTGKAQAQKMREECDEAYDAALELHFSVMSGDLETDPETVLKLKDGIGDTCVTLILLADMHGWTLEECLQFAYDEIKGRTGEMKDGTFIKDN